MVTFEELTIMLLFVVLMGQSGNKLLYHAHLPVWSQKSRRDATGTKPGEGGGVNLVLLQSYC